MKFEKIINFAPAFDKRDPNPSKNYGIHGVELRFVLKGKKGATQFVLYTNWHLPHVAMEIKPALPLPADVGYHSPTPMYEGQTAINENCEYLDGKPCYYDGSGLQAEDVYKILLEKGSDGVWKELEERYNDLFETDYTK